VVKIHFDYVFFGNSPDKLLHSRSDANLAQQGLLNKKQSRVAEIMTHTRTVVRECFRDDEASQWKRPKFDPSPHQNPLTIFTNIGRRDYVLDGTQHAKFCSNRFRGFCSPNTWFCRTFGVTSMFGFLGYFNKATTYTPGRKIRQMTSFRARKCLLGVPMTIFYISTLKFPKNRHSGDRFWLDLVFLWPKTTLTWGCSNINYP